MWAGAVSASAAKHAAVTPRALPGTTITGLPESRPGVRIMANLAMGSPPAAQRSAILAKSHPAAFHEPPRISSAISSAVFSRVPTPASIAIARAEHVGYSKATVLASAASPQAAPKIPLR